MNFTEKEQLDLEKKIPKLVLEFDKLFEKILDKKETLKDFRTFRNKLLRKLKC